MESIRNDARSEERNMLERDVIVMAEKVLGHVPEWFIENKKIIEHNRVEAAEATSQHLAELKRILELLGS